MELVCGKCFLFPQMENGTQRPSGRYDTLRFTYAEREDELQRPWETLNRGSIAHVDRHHLAILIFRPRPLPVLRSNSPFT